MTGTPTGGPARPARRLVVAAAALVAALLLFAFATDRLAPPRYGPEEPPSLPAELRSSQPALEAAQNVASAPVEAAAPIAKGDDEEEAPEAVPKERHEAPALSPLELAPGLDRCHVESEEDAEPAVAHATTLVCGTDAEELTVASRLSKQRAADCVSEFIDDALGGVRSSDGLCVFVRRENAGCELEVPEELWLRCGTVERLGKRSGKVHEALLARTELDEKRAPSEAECARKGIPPDNCTGELVRHEARATAWRFQKRASGLVACVEGALFEKRRAPAALTARKKGARGLVTGNIAIDPRAGFVSWREAECDVE